MTIIIFLNVFCFYYISVAYQVKAGSSPLFRFYPALGLVLTMSLMAILSSVSTSFLYSSTQKSFLDIFYFGNVHNRDISRWWLIKMSNFTFLPKTSWMFYDWNFIPMCCLKIELTDSDFYSSMKDYCDQEKLYYLNVKITKDDMFTILIYSLFVLWYHFYMLNTIHIYYSW